MREKIIKGKVHNFFIFFLVVVCILYLSSKTTYTSYESELDANIDSPIAGWNILIDNKSVTAVESTDSLKIESISWDTSNVREGKVAPGSKGDMIITIDPSGTDVAIYFELEVIDKSVDSNKLLLVTNITFGRDTELVKINDNTFAGILSLDDISAGKKPALYVKVLWDGTEDMVYDPEIVGNLDSYLVMNFRAKQYLGEESLSDYTG